MLSRRSVFAVAALASLSCATAEIAKPGTPAVAAGIVSVKHEVPAANFIDMGSTDFAVLFAKEAAKVPEQSFASPDGRFTGTLRSTAKLVFTPAEGKTLAQLDGELHAGESISCSIDPKVLVPADRLERLISGLKMNLAIKGVAPASVEAVNGHALVAIEFLYTAENGNQVGDFQVAFFHVHGGASLWCTHDGTSYRETFLRSVRRLAETFHDAQARPRAVHDAAIFAARLNGHLVGYTATESGPDRADGSFEDWTVDFLSLANPAAPDSPLLNELHRIDQRDAKGAIAESNVTLDQKGTWWDLQLARDGSGYAVAGTKENGANEKQPFSARLTSELPLAMPGALARRELAEGKRAELRFASWTPSRPGQLVQHVLRSLGDGRLGDYLDAAAQGPADTTLTLDAKGDLESLSSVLAPDVTLVMTKIWGEGSAR